MSKTATQIKEIISKIPKDLVRAEHNDRGHFYRHIPTDQVFASVTTKCGILDAPHLKKWSARLAVEHIIQKIQLLPLEERTLEKMVSYQTEAILVHQDQFEQAGDIGTRGHGAVDRYLQEWLKTGSRPKDITEFIEDKEDARMYAIARSAEQFCIDYSIIPIASEMFVVSPNHGIGGTLDSLMMVLFTTKKGNKSCDDHIFLQRSNSKPNLVKCLNCELEGEYKFTLVDFKTSNSIDKIEYAMQVSAYSRAVLTMSGIKPQKLIIVRFDKKQKKYEVREVINPTEALKAFISCGKIFDWMNNGQEKLVSVDKRERIEFSNLIN